MVAENLTLGQLLMVQKDLVRKAERLRKEGKELPDELRLDLQNVYDRKCAFKGGRKPEDGDLPYLEWRR